MIVPVTTELWLAPAKRYVEATIVSLTAEMMDEQLSGSWWTDPALKRRLHPMPIDRHWDWNKLSIDYEGRRLASEQVAIITGDGSVQGAMMISTDSVESALNPGCQALFVELLFTAPRNRPQCRHDGGSHLAGIGIELLSWGAWLSRETGLDGRLRLDGSPDFVAWYENRGLQKLDLPPIVFEQVAYLPMELSAQGAIELLTDWSG